MKKIAILAFLFGSLSFSASAQTVKEPKKEKTQKTEQKEKKENIEIKKNVYLFISITLLNF